MSVPKIWPIVSIMIITGMVHGPASWAAGPIHGAKGAAMGTAFAAVAEDPSAIAHNPAGLGFLKGTRIYSGAAGVTTRTYFNTADGSAESTQYQTFFPPHLFVSSELDTPSVVIGLGIFSPFGIGGRKWSESGMFRYVSTESYIATIAANPVIAWRPNKSISLSAGAVYLRVADRMERRVDQSLFGAGDGTLRFDADGDGWGWNLGILLKPGDRYQIGAAYRSAVDAEVRGEIDLHNIAPPLQPFFGGASFSSPASMRVRFPSTASFGVCWRPAPPWTLTVEVEWGNWSRFDQQRIEVQRQVPAAELEDMDIELGWKDGWLFKLGSEYRIDRRLALRWGYAYVTHLVPDTTLTPANPDADQHNIFLGTGARVCRLTIDTFLSFCWYENRAVDNAVSSGTYRTLGQMLGVSIGWRF